MDLTPDLLLEAKFAPARRGYDMNEVDDFLERCAEGLDVLLARLRAEFERAERAEAALAAAGADVPGPSEVAAPAPAAPQPVAPPPAAEPDPARVEEPMRILIAAERTAEAAVAEARAEAERIRTEAESIASTTRSEAETLLARSRAEAEAEARQAGEEARRTIEAEVLALREDRDLLAHDVASLRGWLDGQRDRLRSAAADLQRLVDDPSALGEVVTPELHETSGAAEVAAPAPDEADEIVDARGAGHEAEARFGGGLFDDDGGEPTQAHPQLGDELDGPPAVFDDERASSAWSGSDVIR